jgi:hypothetical protein
MCEKNLQHLMFLLPTAGALATSVLWLFDRRNRDQYSDCMKAGEILENRAESTTGMFVEMGFRHRKGEDSFSHSKTIDGAFGAGIVAFIFLALLLSYWDCTGLC